MALKVIVFDCDGVILESVDIKSRAFYSLGLEISPQAAERLLAFHLAHCGVNRREKFAWLFQETLGRPIRPEELEDWSRKFEEYTLGELLTCPMVPGALEVLEHWRGRRPLYVASGASTEDLRFVLEKRGLARYFQGIYGFPPSKDEILARIVAETGVEPREALLVGDASTDLAAASAVGTLFYGRGEFFKNSGQAWHPDLTRLNEHLESLR